MVATKSSTTKKVVSKPNRSARQKAAPQHIGIVRNDPYLEPYEAAIRGRHEHALWKIGQLTNNGKRSLSDFASGADYFGLHKLKRGWVFREWAPNATDIYLVGDFNDWKESDKYRATRIEGTGNWELKLPERAMRHGDLYKMHVYWNGGQGERIPAWAQRVVQDDATKIFSAHFLSNLEHNHNLYCKNIFRYRRTFPSKKRNFQLQENFHHVPKFQKIRNISSRQSQSDAF